MIPSVPGPVVVVGAQTSVTNLLSTQLDTDLTTVPTVSKVAGAHTTNAVASQVINQQFIRLILSRQDTYSLLNTAVSDWGGAPGTAYTSTGGLIDAALSTSTKQSALNAASDVPGLRLVAALAHNQYFAKSEAAGVIQTLHIAEERQVLSLSAAQQDLVAAGYAQFLANVNALNAQGVFTPSTPPLAAKLPGGHLKNTVEVSLGSFRVLDGVAASQSGLPLPGIGNFTGRIDLGFVINRSGNFGLVITAQGPVSDSPLGITSTNLVGGDVRITVSNAPNLSSLGGLSQVESLTQGGGQSGNLEASRNSDGVSTFAASTGYGSGFEFGTGIAYTEVVPLGNAFALIPEYPKTPVD
jgi:hypothetical protein